MTPQRIRPKIRKFRIIFGRFLYSGTLGAIRSYDFNFSSPNKYRIENDAPIKNDDAPDVANDAWIKSQI